VSDIAAELIERIRSAADSGQGLRIVGGNSKPFFGREAQGEVLDIGRHSGIVAYEPKELVLTARAATPLAEIEAALAENGQMLAFEPPRYGDAATLGGTLACNLSGPRRPWAGSVRDAVLGVRLINGMGEHMRFGGQVMKNVAGFDASRLQAGALGAFGVITEISLKVLPQHARMATLVQECALGTAVERMNGFAAQPKPLTGAAWLDGKLYLRLGGAASAVAATQRDWGGETLEAAATFWRDLTEHRLPYFQSAQPLWRFSIKSTTAPADDLGEPWLLDWAGAQRWLHGEFDKARLESAAEAAGGHVTLYRRGDRTGEVNHRLADTLKTLHLKLKSAFDPQRILNPGRLYSWL